MLKKHPSVYLLIHELIKEQKKMEDNLIKLETGIVHKRKPEYLLIDERIKNVLSTYKCSIYSSIFENLSTFIKY